MKLVIGLNIKGKSLTKLKSPEFCCLFEIQKVYLSTKNYLG